MTRRPLTVVALCLGVVFAAALVRPSYAQEKKEAPAAAKGDRIDGTVKSVDAKTKTISVRLRGKTASQDVTYDDKTQITFRNKPSTIDEVKDERRVICLGKAGDKGVFHATRIDVRDKG